MWSRRAALTGLAGAGAGITAYAQRASTADVADPIAGESLGALAGRAGLLFGASIAGDFKEPSYKQLYIDHARVLTSDLALKLAILRPDRGEPHYGDADLLLDFAEQQKMAFRGHCLVWNESNPAWVNSLRKEEVGALLDRHVEETVTRYRGRMHSWDVVNEPFWPDHRAPRGFRKGPWYNALGEDYVARALRRAAKADPGAKLVVNEAFAERGDALGLSVREGMLRLIDDLQHKGVPLHAIGLEAHLQPQYTIDDEGFGRFLEAIAARKLEIYITELDVDDTALPRDIAARDEAAARRVREFLRRTLSVEAVKIVECWQLSDRHSWLADPEILRKRPAGDLPRPLPFDRYYARKPMYDAIADAFRERAKRRGA